MIPKPDHITREAIETRTIRVLVCGGRNHANRKAVFRLLDHYHGQVGFSVVIHGNAPGADTLAHEWAELRGVPVIGYSADWVQHGRAAGPIRNAQMLREGKPNVVIAFSGGKGTRDMIKQAQAANVPVLDLREYDL